jgi:MHS family alpha-ketoglutarate permease-like MFS transporter
MTLYLVDVRGIDPAWAAVLFGVPQLVGLAGSPLAGWLSDRIGRKPLLIAFGTLGALGTYPIFRLLEQADNSFTAFLLVLAALLIVTGYTAINAVVKAELFPAHIRALGVALPYALANAVFGGTAEYVALWFKSVGLERGFYWYVTGMIALSLFAYLRMPETRHTSEIAED